MKSTTVTGGERAAADALDRAPTGRKLEQLLAQESLQAMRQLRDSTTELAAQLRGGIQNSVLDVRMATFPSSGILQYEYRVSTGSVFVVNSGGSDITMVSGPGSSDRPPGDGVGAALVPAGSSQLINVAAHYVTFYGTSGQRFSFQVFAKAQPPSAGQVDSIAGAGAVTTLVGTNPAAGADWSQTVPAGEAWELVSLRFSLVTDATVATRVVKVTLDDGANVFAVIRAASTHVASLTQNYTYARGVTDIVLNSNEVLTPLPSGLILPAGYRISSSVALLQAADDLSAPVFNYIRRTV